MASSGGKRYSIKPRKCCVGSWREIMRRGTQRTSSCRAASGMARLARRAGPWLIQRAPRIKQAPWRRYIEAGENAAAGGASGMSKSCRNSRAILKIAAALAKISGIYRHPSAEITQGRMSGPKIAASAARAPKAKRSAAVAKSSRLISTGHHVSARATERSADRNRRQVIKLELVNGAARACM